MPSMPPAGKDDQQLNKSSLTLDDLVTCRMSIPKSDLIQSWK